MVEPEKIQGVPFFGGRLYNWNGTLPTTYNAGWAVSGKYFVVMYTSGALYAKINDEGAQEIILPLVTKVEGDISRIYLRDGFSCTPNVWIYVGDYPVTPDGFRWVQAACCVYDGTSLTHVDPRKSWGTHDYVTNALRVNTPNTLIARDVDGERKVGYSVYNEGLGQDLLVVCGWYNSDETFYAVETTVTVANDARACGTWDVKSPHFKIIYYCAIAPIAGNAHLSWMAYS